MIRYNQYSVDRTEVRTVSYEAEIAMAWAKVTGKEEPDALAYILTVNDRDLATGLIRFPDTAVRVLKVYEGSCYYFAGSFALLQPALRTALESSSEGDTFRARAQYRRLTQSEIDALTDGVVFEQDLDDAERSSRVYDATGIVLPKFDLDAYVPAVVRPVELPRLTRPPKIGESVVVRSGTYAFMVMEVTGYQDVNVRLNYGGVELQEPFTNLAPHTGTP